MKKNSISIIFLALLIDLLSISASHADVYDINTLLNKAVQGHHRNAINKARDVYRHPRETLLFFGIKPDMKVLEILPGRGWYTEILAPVLKDKGQLTVASFGKDHPNDYLRNIHNDYVKYLSSNPGLYSDIRLELFQGDNYLDNIESNSQDMVLTFRNAHNWIRYGGIEKICQSFHRVLKKGGVLGIVQHRANKGSDAARSSQQGYVPENYLIGLLENTGFTLLDKSEMNANTKDSKDHPEGVWSLPPSYREGDSNREKYTAIGESDRMTLRFIKL